MALQRWVATVAEEEVERIIAKCQRHHGRQGSVPRWVERGMGESGMGERYSWLEQLDELEQEAERKGGVLQMLTDRFARVYKVPAQLAA
jgi:hypothetical protein